MQKQEPKRVLAVVSDLFFSVKLSEAAKRNGLALEFVKEGKEVLEKAKAKPTLIVFDLNFETVSPLALIAKLKAKYLAAGNPVFSLDTKAKEHLGQLFREGRVWTQQAFRAFDHDFPSLATGVIIPHGIYDLARNRGHINIGLSHDTSQFACDSFRWYWNRIGQQCYPDAASILLLCDCGGSNSAAQYLFKQDLQHLVNDLGIEIRVAHYPSYCSKFNPIERRFFPHVGRACQGMLFDTLDTVVRLMRKASTTTGLRTTVNIIHRAYEIGRKVDL